MNITQKNIDNLISTPNVFGIDIDNLPYTPQKCFKYPYSMGMTEINN